MKREILVITDKEMTTPPEVIAAGIKVEIIGELTQILYKLFEIGQIPVGVIFDEYYRIPDPRGEGYLHVTALLKAICERAGIPYVVTEHLGFKEWEVKAWAELEKKIETVKAEKMEQLKKEMQGLFNQHPDRGELTGKLLKWLTILEECGYLQDE